KAAESVFSKRLELLFGIVPSDLSFQSVPVFSFEIAGHARSLVEVNFPQMSQLVEQRGVDVAPNHGSGIATPEVDQVYVGFKQHTKKHPGFFDAAATLEKFY